MRRTPRTRLALASVAAVATLVVGACGGDDDDDTEPVATEAPSGTDAVDETAATVEGSTDTTTAPDDTGEATNGTSSGEVGEREEYVEAVTAELEPDLEDPSQAECFAEAIVSDDVYTAIQDAGVSVDDFAAGPQAVTIDVAQAEDIAGELAACGDMVSQFAPDEAQAACFTDNLDNEQLALLVTLAAFGLEPTEELTAVQDEIQACIETTATTG